jgi:hypothetical protein
MEQFEEYLVLKYPHLFYEKGDPCPCGAWVPNGWKQIVADLCGSITSYTKHTYRHKRRVVNKMYYVWISIAESLDWMHRKFIKLFPQFNKWQFNKPVFAFIEKFRRRSYKCVEYDKVYPPAVKIDQIKEKYGELRFYISGGDEQVRGMIHMAEYLCNKTCEVTGKPGVLCVRGGWYKTLSPDLLKESIYEGYKPVKQ